MTKINTYAWSKEASELVARNLVREVVGSIKNDASSDRADGLSAAKLPSEQIPNGQRSPSAVAEGAEPVSAAKLPKEQTPVKTFDSGIVEAARSATSTVRTAGEDEDAPKPADAPVEGEEGAIAPVAPVADPAPLTPVAPIADPMAPVAAPVAPAFDPMAPAMDGTAPVAPAFDPAAPAPAPIVGDNDGDETPVHDDQERPYEVEACGIRMASSAMGYGTKISAEEAALLAQVFGDIN